MRVSGGVSAAMRSWLYGSRDILNPYLVHMEIPKERTAFEISGYPGAWRIGEGLNCMESAKASATRAIAGRAT